LLSGFLFAAALLIACAARADTLYISYSNGDNYVEEFSTSGTSGVNTDLGPLPNTTTDVATPNGIALDANNNLYVANDGNNTISKFDPTGKYIGVFATGLNQPAAIAFDPYGNLFVVNGGASTILKITPAGTQSVFVSSGLSNPQGLAFDTSGNLYVSDQGSNSIKKITPAGAISTFYSDGSYTILSQVEGLAFDTSGNLYVASYRNNAIEKITPAGVATLFANNPSPASDPNDPNNPTNPEGLYNPIGLAFDSSGDLFVGNYHHTQVANEPYEGHGITYVDEFAPNGTLINAFTGNPGLPGADANLRDANYIAIKSGTTATLLPDNLQVTSTSAFAASGLPGGPFAPGAESYTITDGGVSSLSWTASATQSWLSLSATSGTLGASGSTQVTASINAGANTLTAGTYTDTITFTNTTTGYTQTEGVSLTVIAPPAASAPPVFSSPLGVIAYSGTTFSFQLVATNTPVFEATGLPAGLSINYATGIISGTATTLGTYYVTITAVNSAGNSRTTLNLTVAPPTTWGFLSQGPPNEVTVTSQNRNNVFYVGSPITLQLSNPTAAVSYEIRDYWGNVVEQGPASQFIFPQVSDPGWYKVYIRGATNQQPWGNYVGASTFVIWRNNPNFPAMPPLNTWGGNGLDDGVVRGIAAIGPDRHQVDCTDATNSIATVSQAIAVDNQYYSGMDPVRPRKLLCSFGNGTSNLAGVAQIVTALKGSVKYWEPRNEPNFSTDPATFINNELIPFYNTVKGIDPSLKVLAPEIVTIGPPEQGWVQGFFAAGGAKYIDGFSFHAYNNVNGDLWLTEQTMSYLDSILAPYPNLERWQTEQGYDAALFGSYQPRLQGRWTMLQMMVFEQHGIPKEQNHLWYDKSGGFWTAPTWWENLDGTLNPGAALMRVWSEEVFGASFAEAFDFGNPGNKLYVGDLFTGPGKKVAAFITAGSPCETIELTDTGDASVQLVSPFGVTRSVPVQNNQFTISISEVPSYVEFSGTLNVVPINSGSDIALMPGTTASASGDGLYPSEPTVPNSTSKIIDGVLQNWYWTQQDPQHPWMDDTPGFPAWVEVDFPSAQTINNVIVYAGVPWQLDGTLVDYDLQYYNNGQWINLGTVKEPTKTFQAYMPTNWTQVDSFFSDHWVFQHWFAPVTTQKIRLWVRDATWGGGATQLVAQSGGQTGQHHICLREIEAYNSPNPLNTAQNQPPVATGTSVTTAAETPVLVNVLNCASDPDNGPAPLSIQCVGAAANGIVSKVGTEVEYNPNPGFSGTDAFTYTVTDGVATATASVNVTVTPVSGPPYPAVRGLIGLVGEYFSDQNLTTYLFSRQDGEINFHWGYGSPAPSMSTGHYSVLWSGTVQPAFSENYTFYTDTSDGVRLWVNGQELVNDWQDQATAEESWSLPLQAGQQYPVVMQYYEDSGSSAAVLSWSSPSQPKEVIPPFPQNPTLQTGGLVMVQGQYFNTPSLTGLADTRIESSIDFNWSSAAPFPNLNQGSFSVKWTGQILAQYSENYTFTTTSDDGVRLWVNGQELVNDWSGHAATLDSGTIPLVSGSYYNMEMDYYQYGGSSVAELQWSSPSQPLEVIQEVPEEAWARANFTSAQFANTALSGPTGDADGDGMPNLLKYAFDINPLSSGTNGWPSLSFYNTAGRNYMALTYRRNIAATDLIYDVQVSTSLSPSSWTTTTVPEDIIGQDQSSGDLYIRRSIDITGLSSEFMRLNVW
jgi:sugar lactone lactonase YvrE